MHKIILIAALLLGLAAPVFAAGAAAPAQTPAPAAGTPAPSLAPIATQLGQTIQTLVGVPSSQPGQNAAEASPEDAAAQWQVADTFASTLISTMLQTFESIRNNNKALTANAAAIPDFNDWLSRQASDPRRIVLWQSIGRDLLQIVGIALLCGMGTFLVLVPVRANIRRKNAETIGLRIATLVALFGARIIPVFVFLGVSLFLLERNEPHNLPRFVIMNVIYAVAAVYALTQIILSAFSPRAAGLRLVPMTDDQASHAHNWINGFTVLIALGYFTVDVANALRLPSTTITLFQNMLGVTLTVMAITVIVQIRARVAAILRSQTEPDAPSFTYALRLWLARHWHSLAIAYLVIGITIAVLGIENGLALMLRGTVLTIAIVLALRFGFITLERWTHPPQGSSGIIHRQILAFVFRPLAWVAAATGIAAVWGLHVGAVMSLPWGQKAVSAFASVVITLTVLTAIYELLNNAIERHLDKRDKQTKQPIASARARTLLPMVRNSVFVLFSAATVITILDAVGVNIGPILAGAGVLGVALGFGSQTLVKDFLTGLFIVVENTVAVGDVVKIGEFTGVVEAMSIRTIRLRAQDGSLYIMPFSEVSRITNMTKGFAYAVVDVGVAYNSDLNKVMEELRQIGAEIQEDPIFKFVVLEPIEVLGVETLGDFSITIRARMRTRPGKQWDVKRRLLLRIQECFAKDGIEIPYPVVTNLTKRIE